MSRLSIWAWVIFVLSLVFSFRYWLRFWPRIFCHGWLEDDGQNRSHLLTGLSLLWGLMILIQATSQNNALCSFRSSSYLLLSSIASNGEGLEWSDQGSFVLLCCFVIIWLLSIGYSIKVDSLFFSFWCQEQGFTWRSRSIGCYVATWLMVVAVFMSGLAQKVLWLDKMCKFLVLPLLKGYQRM